jgi:hypothetical protein
MSDGFLGLNLRDVAIGVQGSISGIFFLRRSKPRDIIACLVTGGLTANYLGPSIGDKLGTSHDLSVYLAGVVGWTVCHVAVEYAWSWSVFRKLKND